MGLGFAAEGGSLASDGRGPGLLCQVLEGLVERLAAQLEPEDRAVGADEVVRGDAPLGEGTGEEVSARRAGPQVGDHIPEPDDLAALDDFERLRAAEGLVRCVEPPRDGIRCNDLGGRLLEPVQFLDVPQARLAALPVGNAGPVKPTRREKSPRLSPSRPRTDAAEAA